ncbi:hypothetical protein DFJ43DRAFT_1035818 [Lentinula guzmanii]|uniref:Uncharacterized protein n=1 Tax=Lentinula guzmanii TaxID=2804957 RepID=A0AA38JWX7_9AGAR|nr:hypothetical protein DFJ43DRAFT_1035818 [Lentinula guzmanii]
MATAAVEPSPDGSLISGNDKEPDIPEDTSQSPPDVAEDVNKEPAQLHSQSPRIYSRLQILALSKSPLVCIPQNMPELRDCPENEQNLSRKESDPTTPNSGRERRFRRDGEENELPARPSFRSSMSQPSQMGNFKHQSMRSNDRDLEREGQERLRNVGCKASLLAADNLMSLSQLSEKFDRDRLNGPLSNIRTEKRNIVPTTSNRISSQSQGTIASRRAETREAAKKKVGESNEDWRRGAETRRSERNDRGDRDERPRSRSRHRRETSPARRDRDGKERDKERDDYRRDRDDDDDSRRWRDDGRRDDRLASRRERERGPNGKDKDSNSGNPNDRRWTVVEERDVRSKRNTARDKKTFPEEGRADDRRGDREKEKEPAWMDTYVPSSSTGGILGSKGNEGELDGIQAWKKNMRKEQKAKAAPAAPVADSSDPPSASADTTDEPMDEIQRFKKMMEVAQKQSSDSPLIVGPIVGLTDTSKPSSPRENGNVVIPEVADAPSGGEVNAAAAPSKLHIPSAPDPSRSLLSLLNSNNTVAVSPDTDSALPKLYSRLPLADNSVDRMGSDTTFNPPQGSRLLALGSRVPAKPVTPNAQLLSSAIPNGGSISTSTTTPKPQIPGFPNLSNPPALVTESLKVSPRSGFSPFEEQRELGDALRRQVGDRSPFITDPVGQWPELSPLDSTTAGHAIGKGSRFAKFFDGKGKEMPSTAPIIPKAPTPVGFISSSPGPHVRPDSGFGNLSNPNLEQHRTVDELFAKLNMNPLQGQRAVSGPNSAALNHAQFTQQAQTQLQSLQQQQHQQQLQNQLHNAARLEPLYESRNFMPDNLVPGLRSAPPPRNRDNGGMYAADPLDDALLLNAHQRLPVQQQRGIEQMYGGTIPASFAQQQQLARSVGIPVQAPHFRGGPSPVSAQQLHTGQQQRMPPGLANLGGRPPHDPSQFNIPGPLPNGLHINNPPPQQQQQQSFNNFHSTVGFGGPQGPLRPPAHQLQNTVNHHQLAGLGHPSNLDSRSVNQHAQLLAMSGLGGAVGLRNISGSGGGFNHQSGNSLQNQMLAMRQQAQQQQQQIHPQMLPPHLLPPHLQQGPPIPTTQTTSAQDLMALLMGTHRD